MARTQIRFGSSGSDVRELQKTLNQNGYNLQEDGIFGSKTDAAVRAYQKASGLAVDGIVGNNTWNSLLNAGKAVATAATNPPVNPMPTGATYDKSTWDDSEKGQAALGDYNSAKDAVANYGDFQYGNKTQLDGIIDKILNREQFSYDLNGDALYQQYKDKYIQQGKMAMGDAIGQASAMTGGYGNSYAQSVGQQAYQASLDNLNDIVPELYQMAYDRYNQEGQDLYNQYGMLSDDYNREYGVWNDKYGKLMDALGIAKSDYYDGGDMFYTEQNNKNTIAGREFDEAMAIWDANNTNAWRQKELDETKRQFDKDMAFKEKQHNEIYGAQAKTANDSVKSYSGTTTKGKSYNNGGLTNGQIKELQAALGVTADGYYGSASKEAAGGLSAKEAYAKFVGSSNPQNTNNPTNNTPAPKEESKDWELVGDGGINWFGGIDNNVKVKSPIDGKTYQLGDLYDEAVKQNKAAGMSSAEAKAEAKAWVLGIQRKVGG